MNKKTIEELESLAIRFFACAQYIQSTSRTRFQAEHKLSRSAAYDVFPGSEWRDLQDKWALSKIESALDETCRSVVVREKFGIKTILKRLRGTGIGYKRFMRVGGDQWRDRRMQLPTGREKVLMVIQNLVAKRVTLRELTMASIFDTAGVRPIAGPWLWAAVLSARRELLKHQVSNDDVQPPEGVRALTLPGGWVDLDANLWDLRSGSGGCLKKNLLRSDIADIAWEQMSDALLGENLACITVTIHFKGYRLAGELLGREIPDVREATLERVQRAWLSYQVKPKKLEATLAALRRIFAHLCGPEAAASGVNVKEMLRISAWLYTSATVQFDSLQQDVLSDFEMNAVIAGCLADIKAGLDFTESGPDLLSLPTRPRSKDNAAQVVQWAAALMLLLMLFTGLRPQSVMNLEIGDWAELRHGLFALVWSHGRKREENVSILAASVALLMNQYVERTAKVRQALRTQRVFLISNLNSYWSAMDKVERLRDLLFPSFVKRHGLKRDSVPLKLNGRMLRRTYVTRELYMGRSIWALRLQLGHESIRTTRRYGNFDQFEHPSQVGSALDEYGRRFLALWRHPLLLSDLDPAEVDTLLGAKEERHQDVGLCRFSSCREISSGNPPPCSLCAHLVTGPEFLGAWGIEQQGREDEIKRLQSIPDANHLLAQKKSQYEMFLANLAYVKDEKHT